MRMLKLFCAVTVVLVCMFSFSISSSALTPSIDYTCKNSLGQNAVPPLKLNDFSSGSYKCIIIFSQNSSGYGYWTEIYMPIHSGVTYYVAKTSSYINILYTNTNSSAFNPPALNAFVYGEDGSLVYTMQSHNVKTGTISGNVTSPCSCLQFTFGSYWSGDAILTWLCPYYTGEFTSVTGSSVTSVTPNTGWSFTFNNEDTEYDPETGEPVTGGGGGNTGCQCVDYTDVLETIVSNQENQLTKLNQIISILQSNSNQVVVNAINDAVDDVNDNLNNRTRSVPDSYDSSGLDDYNSEQAATDEAIDDFKDGHDFSDVFDDFDITDFNDAMSFWEDLFDDIVGTNPIFLVVIVSMLTLGIIVVILNRKVGT